MRARALAISGCSRATSVRMSFQEPNCSSFTTRIPSSTHCRVEEVFGDGLASSAIMRLAALDRAHVWHPFTQMQTWLEPLPGDEPLIIDHARGCWLFDTRGRKYLDAVSSLWVNIHGHHRPEIDSAIKLQLEYVAHTTLLGLASPPSIERAAELVRRAPRAGLGPNESGLTRVFYSDNGSTAVEVALKMAFQ